MVSLLTVFKLLGTTFPTSDHYAVASDHSVLIHWQSWANSWSLGRDWTGLEPRARVEVCPTSLPF